MDVAEATVWCVRLELVSEPGREINLEVRDEAILGRGDDLPNLVDLSLFGADSLGVSRQHLLFRSTPTNLYAIDLGSTNGTLRNGRSIGVKTPYPVVDGDILTLGMLQLVVSVLERPSLHTAPLERPMELAEALSQIAKAITSQLNLNDVLHQVAETAMMVTQAGEAGIWLVDEHTGELFLEVERGITDERVLRMRLPIHEGTIAGQVVNSGKPMRASRKPGEDRIKVKTDYLVEALVHVPITLGGVTFGVLAAAHREPGKQFARRDETLLTAIADFAAIAIQNARLYEATDEALSRRVKELAALNEVSRAVSSSLNLDRVYDVLVAQVQKHWPVEAVRLYLTNQQKDGLFLFRTSEKDKKDNKLERLNRGFVARVAENGRVAVSSNLSAHPDYEAVVDRFHGDEPYSIAAVPLRVQDKVVGVLTLLNKVDGQFEPEDVEQLEALANPVATAIENARLFQETLRQQSAIQATAHAFSHPLLILDENDDVLIANHAANELLEANRSQLFEGIRKGIGCTTELRIGDRTYLSSAEHLADVGTILVMQDISYVKQLELERSEFMHALSHDLKSPLTSIMGFAQLLERVYEFDSRGQHYLRSIIGAVERLLEMINHLLQALAWGDTVQLIRKESNLHRVIEKVLRDVEGAALNKRISLEFHQTGEPYDILADETRLYHMILNLTDNALKFSPVDGRVQLLLHYNEEAITFTVQDGGPGIPEQDIPHIFDKYYRGMQAKTEQGAGLGLSVVWAIAHAHGGHVMVENLADKGAQFTITLPSSLRVTAVP